MSLRVPSNTSLRRLVPFITILSNVLSYLLFLVAARLLDRATYGETLALLNVVVVATIPAFAIQTVVARRTATGAVGPRLLRSAAIVGLGCALLIALASPVLVEFLHLPGYLGVIGGALTVPPLVVLGFAQGIAQGNERWGLLCGAVLLMGVGRVAGGIAGLVAAESSTGALAGTAVGLMIACLFVLRPSVRMLHHSRLDETQTVRGLFVETAHAAHAHGAFLLLASLDLLIARNVLTADQAGWYAAGNVVFRAALWLPQPVATLLFPAMSDTRRHRHASRQGVAVVGALVAVTVGVCVAFGGLVSLVVGGNSFEDLADDVWMFAVAGGALALTQFCIYAGLSLQRRGRLTLVWACIGAEFVAAYALGFGDTPHQLIGAVAVIVATSAVIAVAQALVESPERSRRPLGAKVEVTQAS
ncbi:MAG: lipopolysaccharide biosynthesis protein [Cumulibacter sp.]